MPLPYRWYTAVKFDHTWDETISSIHQPQVWMASVVPTRERPVSGFVKSVTMSTEAGTVPISPTIPEIRSCTMVPRASVRRSYREPGQIEPFRTIRLEAPEKPRVISPGAS